MKNGTVLIANNSCARQRHKVAAAVCAEPDMIIRSACLCASLEQHRMGHCAALTVWCFGHNKVLF